MSEQLTTQARGLRVQQVEPGSPAHRAGVGPGDIIQRINGYAIDDVADLRYHASEERFTAELSRNGATLDLEVEREWGEDLGFTFDFDLAGDIHTCDNKCVFCFIHQMPKGMRKSLYLMDDDFRLSFLHGHYVTLTNMTEAEFERVKEQRLSPIYVSVHASEPRLRGFMLGRPGPEPVLPRLRELAEHGISVHCQVVLCPGLNDGAALEQTIADLASLHPSRSGLRDGVMSVAVVPVGLSKFRHNLYPVRRVTPEYSVEFLRKIAALHKTLRAEMGTRFVFPSDEWFFNARKPMPGRSWYEEFPQLEDGVGTCRLFLDESRTALHRLPKKIDRKSSITLVTGILSSGVIGDLAAKLNGVENLSVDVCVVRNEFFGHGITVAGLLTGQDVIAGLQAQRARGIVCIPDVALKDGEVFLDNITLSEVRSETGADVRATPSRARQFIREWLPRNVFDQASAPE